MFSMSLLSSWCCESIHVPWKFAGQEGGLPVFGVFDWESAGAHGDEAGEVLIFAAKSVKNPGSGAGAWLNGIAAVHEHERGFVIGNLCLH